MVTPTLNYINFNRIHVRLNAKCERELGLRATDEFLRLVPHVAGMLCFCTHLKGQLDLVRECVKGQSPLFSVSFVLFGKIQATNYKTVLSLTAG